MTEADLTPREALELDRAIAIMRSHLERGGDASDLFAGYVALVMNHDLEFAAQSLRHLWHVSVECYPLKSRYDA